MSLMIELVIGELICVYEIFAFLDLAQWLALSMDTSNFAMLQFI